MFLITRIKILFLWFCLLGADDVSFKEITVYWKLNNSSYGETHIASSNNLKENLSNTSSEIGVEVETWSTIPVLYENSVSDITNLEYLQLMGVKLEEIRPRAFKNLQVKALMLSHNELTNLSRGIFENVELEILYLRDNWISNIESGAFSGLNLSKLDLSSNDLEEIDSEVFNISNLKYLDLGINNIKTLRPGDLQNLPKLVRLKLSFNKLKRIVEGTFKNSDLDLLFFHNNEISSIDSKSFDNMTKLAAITLGHNKLTEWDKNWFYNTPSLRYVHFDDNRIKEIPDKAFQNLNELEELKLDFNEISTFSPNAFVKNEDNSKVKVKELYLGGNNLTCIERPLKDVFGSVQHVELCDTSDDDCKNKFRNCLLNWTTLRLLKYN